VQTITKKYSPTGTTETKAFDLKVSNHTRQTWEFYATGTTLRIKLKSVFTDSNGVELAGSGSGDTAGCDIQTIDLTQDTLTIVNFDMKLSHVRCTYDDDGTGDMAGDLHIKATTAK
jgi:type 1 fimbria pilin